MLTLLFKQRFAPELAASLTGGAGTPWLALEAASIAFLRVERLLDLIVPEDMVGSFSRSNFVGAYFHLPLIALGFLGRQYILDAVHYTILRLILS